MTYLTIIRHGETIENANHLCQGQQPGQLSGNGIKQAKELALKLKNEHPDAFYSSDLTRSMDTSAEILAFHPSVQVIPEPLLRERYMAAWEGKPFPQGWKWEYLPEHAETNEDMLSRAKQFLDKIIEKHSNQQVWAVTHGGLIRAFWTLLSEKPVSEYFSWEEPKNTSVSRVKIDPDRHFEIIGINNTDHLTK